MRSRILVSAIGVPYIFLALYVLPTYFVPLSVSILVGVASFELCRAFRVAHAGYYFIMPLPVALPFFHYFDVSARLLFGVLFLNWLFLFLRAIFSRGKVQLEPLLCAYAMAMFVSAALSMMVRLLRNPDYTVLCLLPLLVSFVCDTSAMLCGMAFGKRKLIPEVSPKKTVEGAIGGVVCVCLGILLYGLIISYLMPDYTPQYHILLLYGFFGSMVAQLGDLSFSYLKRGREIKDYGEMFRGHGGVLDRFDSVIFVAPFLEVLMQFFPAFVQGA